MKLLVFLTLVAAVTLQVKAVQNCQVCVLVSGFIKSELESGNATKAEIRKDVGEMCLELVTTSIYTECTNIVDQHFDKIVQLLQVDQLKPKAVCEQLGLCSATKSPKLDMKTNLKDDIPCPVCLVVMAKVDEFLGNNPTIYQIDQVLRQLCLRYEGEFRQRCYNYLNRFGNRIFWLLVDRMQPNEVCIELDLCEAKPQLDETTQLKDQQSMTHDLQRLQYPVKNTSLKADPVACTICELGMIDVNDYLLENVTDDEISKILDSDCDSLESPVRDECHDMLSKYHVDIIKLMTEKMDPKYICVQLGECDAKQVEVTMRNGEICQVCKLVGQYLLTVLQSNATEEEIEQALKQVCGFLPQSLSQECDSLVEKYDAETFSLLQKLTPDEVCKDMYLCEDKALVNDNKCMIGPKFWCASPANAKMCNAVQHCKNHVW